MKFLFKLFRLKIKDWIKCVRIQKNTTEKDLFENGLVIIKEFIKDDDLQKILKKDIPEHRLTESPEGTKSRFLINANAEEEFSFFFNSSLISSIFTTLIGSNARRLRAVYQRRDFIGWSGAFEQFFHIDSWRYRYKAFLFLTDVKDGNGSLVYIPKSHKGIWRMKYEKELYEHSPLEIG